MTRPKCPDCGATVSDAGCAFCALVHHCRALRLPEPVREYRFASPRRWRFDAAWPACGLALEVEGGLWARGRHNRASGYVADMEKYNRAAFDDWTVVRYTPEQVVAGAWVEDILRWFGRAECE